MAVSPPDPPRQPPLGINHDQLRKQAAPAFDATASNVREAIRLAGESLGAIAGWPTGEEVDRAFVTWCSPKRDEMFRLIEDYAMVCEDLADGILSMERTVKVIDWGLADDMTVEDIPVYRRPDEGFR